MMGRVLITGGLGYVGGRVAQALAEKTQLDLVVTTRSRNCPRPVWLSRGKLISLDLLSDDELKKACEGVRYIIHFAASNEIDSAANPEEALIINGLGTLKLLRAAEKVGIEKFVYFSTAHVYGAPLQGTITEETVPRPVHPYAITHKVAEDFVLAAQARGKMAGLVFRLSNGFGAATHPEVNRWTLIVNDLCRQAVSTGRLVLRSSGLQKRDFITLEDVASAVIHVLQLPVEKIQDGLFNLGGNFPCRIIDMTEMIAARYETLWGIRLPILRPSPEVDEKEEMLDYRIDKLTATGFILSSRIERELDETLRLCKDAFGSE